MFQFLVISATIIFVPVVQSRELLIQRACRINPDLSFCQNHLKTEEIRSEARKKKDIFLQWAFVAAKDSTDTEDLDTDELESNTQKHGNVDEYCSKYEKNFNSYCKSGRLAKLEGLLAQFCTSYQKNCHVPAAAPEIEIREEFFPTPKPLFPTEAFHSHSQTQTGNTKDEKPAIENSMDSINSKLESTYCDDHSIQYIKECKREGFTSDDFCGNYKAKCAKIETIDEETTSKKTDANEKHDENSDELETLEEFDSKEDVMSKKQEEDSVEGQGANTDEITKYCTNYIENYNFFCVGDMAPEHEKFCESYKKNCPNSQPLQASGGFLGSKGDDEGSSPSDKSLYLYKGSKKEYCDKFSVNYEYYCKGSIINAEIFTKFCPSYKKACLQGAPASPFTASSGQPKPSVETSSGGSDDFPDIDNPTVSTSSQKKGNRPQRIKKKLPCTPDCDQRIFPHCTAECKCDFSYPHVQKFCNPPPLPMFLNTCRLWYYGCPKYERYHYASQFIYSKAEKGKVLEGPKTQTSFQLLTPSGETLPYKPSSRKKRESGLLYWPDDQNEIDPPTQESGMVQFSNVSEPNGYQNITEYSTDMFENDNGVEEPLKQTLETLNKTINVTKRIDLVPAPPLPKNYKAKDQTIYDKSKKLPPAPDLPRTKKTTGGTSVPVFSDSVFSNALSQYNSFTDSRGILHRPRSRSPFTKPGLWEPNPDDPHNRDHANKYFYRPYSTSVDWLQGQLAWGAHWAVPAAGVGGTDGFSALHFPSIGTFLNIPDDYD